MNCKYLDPYKDDPYGKLKGDKAEQYFKVTFNEAKIYKTDDAYILAAYATEYSGIVRGFKPENDLTPGLCAIPIYGKEYGIRKKDKDGKWSEEKFQPSIFEKGLYNKIAANFDTWTADGKGISGSITHMPNGMLNSSTPDQVEMMVTQNVHLLPSELSGRLPEYSPPTQRSFNSGGGKSWGISPDQRIDFLKKQLAADITHSEFTAENTLAELTNRMLKEYPGNEAFISIYFDMLIASIK